MRRIVAAVMLCASFLMAGKGSLYSRYGVGDVNVFLSGKNVGMGGAGLATFSESNINLLNPAGSAAITNSLISLSYQYRFLTSADAGGSSFIGTGNISSLAVAFPVYAPKKMVLSLAMLPFSSVAYELQTTQTVLGNPVVQSFEGRGGLTSGQLSLSYAVMPDITLGVTGHIIFGSIYRDQRITFLSGDYFGGSYEQTFSMSGGALTVGGIWSGVDKALGLSSTPSLNIGATLFTGSSMSFEEQTLRNFAAGQDTIAPAASSFDLPAGMSLGIAWTQNKVLYAFDAALQNWSAFRLPVASSATYQNSLRLAAGVEFLPQSEFIGDGFWKRVSYRAGGYFRRSNIAINGTSINELVGSAGISLPFSQESRIHLAAELGLRGAVTGALIKDTMFRLSLSVSASEIMFIQPPIE